MLTVLADANKVIGIKQTKKAIIASTAKTVYLSLDADPDLRDEITSLCEGKGVSVIEVDSMEKLGTACGIQVGAACAAIV